MLVLPITATRRVAVIGSTFELKVYCGAGTVDFQLLSATFDLRNNRKFLSGSRLNF